MRHRRLGIRFSSSQRLSARHLSSGHAYVALLVGLFVAGACERMPASPGEPAPFEGVVRLRASIQSPAVSTLVVEVTGQGIRDPLVFNLELTGADTDGDGQPDEFTGDGMLVVPAGSARLFTIRVFDDGGVLTHEGSATARVVPGPNESAVVITLEPLNGEIGVTVVLGSVDVVVTPATAIIGPGGTVQLAATITDGDGNSVADATAHWATLDPAVATVDPTGLVTGVGQGSVQIVATFSGVGGAADIVVAPLALADSKPCAWLRACAP